jgi:hypothetical protein
MNVMNLSQEEKDNIKFGFYLYKDKDLKYLGKSILDSIVNKCLNNVIERNKDIIEIKVNQISKEFLSDISKYNLSKLNLIRQCKFINK